MNFNDLGLNERILDAIADEGYDSPTPIQEQAIPAILSGRDVLGLAQTGTGKTAAFALPILETLAQTPKARKKGQIRALILTPTRELGLQVSDSFKKYGRYLSLRTGVVFGGVNQMRQVRDLRKGIDILVATPGRLGDLMRQGYIDISAVEVFVLDEADRMLDMGFIHDIRALNKDLPEVRQTLFFSATMPKEVVQIVSELLNDPVEVTVAPVSSTVDTIEQFIQFVEQKNKADVLAEYLLQHQGETVLVFTRTKRGADALVKSLSQRDISAKAIHGDKSQRDRQAALKSFKEYKTQVLVATDIASRGIDINELSLVVNFELPEEAESYVHRIGRTGRAGSTGKAISYVSPRERSHLRAIERLIKKRIAVIGASADDSSETVIIRNVEVKKAKKHKPKAKDGVKRNSRNDSSKKWKQSGNRKPKSDESNDSSKFGEGSKKRKFNDKDRESGSKQTGGNGPRKPRTDAKGKPSKNNEGRDAKNKSSNRSEGSSKWNRKPNSDSRGKAPRSADGAAKRNHRPRNAKKPATLSSKKES